jgi:hypothetical protein
MAMDPRTDRPAALSPQSLAEQLKLLQRTLDEKWDLLARNQQLHLEILRQQELITRQEMQIQSLQRDLSRMKSLQESDAEKYQGGIQESYNHQEEETFKRLTVEKARYEEKLAQTEAHWSGVLRRAREDHARELAQARMSEGFWAKLVRMMTWS